MHNNSIEISFGVTHNAPGQFCACVKVLYLISGELAVTVNERTHTMYSDDIFVLNAGDAFALSAKNRAIICTVKYELSVLEALGVDESVRFSCASMGGRGPAAGEDRLPALRRLIQEVMYRYLKNGSAVNAAVMSGCYEVLDRLLRDFSFVAADAGDRQRLDRRIREIIAYIQENYASQITLSELAKRFYVSDSHLSRLFKNSLGLGFRDYLTQVRLEAAERELRTTDRSIIRLANDNGFSGLAVFNRSFKEKYGETPSVYKKMMVAREAATLERSPEERIKALPEEAVLKYIEKFETSLSPRNAVRLTELDAAPAHPYEKPWKLCLNMGAATDLLNPMVQKHILKLREQMEFRYVRFWNIFIENFIYFPNAVGSRLYYSKLDSVIDFLLNYKLKPFIQLGPKPRSIISSYGEKSLHLNITSSEDILKLDDAGWQNLLEDVFHHLVTKYGGQEMASWIFEMWSPCPWDVPWTGWYTEERFAALYKVVRKYVPGALVGGCEFTGDYHNNRLPEIARRWHELGVDPDFISFSALPYDPQERAGGHIIAWRPEPEFFEQMVSAAQKAMDDSGLGEKKLFLSLWNITASNRNIINDSVYRGVYTAKTAVSALSAGADLMAFWMGTDAYSDEADVNGMLFGGAGLLSISGVAKPALHALAFLKKLRSQLIGIGPGYIATRNNFGIYSIVYYNEESIPLTAMMRPESAIAYETIAGESGPSESLWMKFRIRNVQNGTYNVRRQYVSRSSGSVLDEWQRLGGLTILAKEDIEYVAMKSLPNRLFSRLTVQNGCMEVEVKAGKNEFGVVEIEFQPGLFPRQLEQ
ncbi:MAG: helix-turn-helix domain-containing protein [Oscillospiraceae bacterium]|nr:helix-turn-helix domain-containing protein [Oscillospiraceae bacterium]